MIDFEIFNQVVVFIFGSIVGSFLNVCIVRLPLEKSVVFPRSHCVNCKKPIPWYDNIPFISYLILLGRCRSCRKKISPRYLLIELLTAVTFLSFYKYYGFNGLLVSYLIMTCGFIVATFVDLEHRIIPDEVSVGGMFVGLLLSLLIPELHGLPRGGGLFPYFLSFWRSILGVLIGGGSIYAMGLLGELIFKKEAMGGGDVKLMAMVGAFLGWKYALLAFFIAPFFGAVYGIIEKIRTKDSTIAYGPFLVLGSLISLFWGDLIIARILVGYGFTPPF